MKSLLWYVLAACGEIAGCFAFWAWLRLGRSFLWTAPGVLSPVVFALALTRIEAAAAGRVFSAYGGIYIVSSLSWLWLMENTQPDRWDLAGASICLAGSAVILYGPHGHWTAQVIPFHALTHSKRIHSEANSRGKTGPGKCVRNR